VNARATLLSLTLIWSAAVAADPSIQPLTEIIDGHQVGGVSVDAVGNLFVADFGDIVWKIAPDGTRSVFASGLYGSSGNAVDHQGNLFQSSFYGDYITRIDRTGHATLFASSGLGGPVGIAIDLLSQELYVANCNANVVVRITQQGVASIFARSELFKCPNGITFDHEGNLYVVNFRDNRMLKIDHDGAVTPFATVSSKGLGHLCFKKDRFYVTAFESHEIYTVMLDGQAKLLLGSGERGLVNGAPARARLSFPNGIACDPWTPRLYINEYDNDSEEGLPRRAIVREITLQDH
jgi:DNA-binding beta-propeller fold protein YncE